MKNVTKIIIALFAIVAFSCTQDDVEKRPVITPGDAPVLTAPVAGAIYELSPANATATAERFTWNSASFGGNVEVVYSVQMDKKGGDFSNAKTLGSVVSGNQVAVTVEVMNGAALGLGSTPFVAEDFDIRVVATTGVSTTIVSAITSIIVKSYTTESPKLWVPGGYQAASGYGSDWTPSAAPQLAASAYGKTDFVGYVYFNAAADYKFTPAPNWDNGYGMGASAGTLDPAGGNIAMATAGYYLIKADTDPTKLTYSTTKTDWGIIGDATPGGWGSSTPMAYDSAKKVWTVTVDLTAAAFKFRANDAWTYNLGKLKVGADGTNLEYDGDNIAVDAGNYTITLDLSTPRVYKYTITKN
jgi:starch-binding outer membrane protein SusE/F